MKSAIRKVSEDNGQEISVRERQRKGEGESERERAAYKSANSPVFAQC